MAEYVEVAKTTELKDGEMKSAKVAGREILLAKAGGKFLAAQNICPHMGGRLSDGKLAGTVVTCPRHGSQFDLSDGHVVRWTNWSGIKLSLAKTFRSPRGIATYSVKVDGDKVSVKV
jgi:3-phenylpropionate/trans-cinnamate dioxygenase ferredoxin subunit